MSQTKAQLIDPVDGTIVNADINASAAIDGSKITPTFTSTVNVTNTLPEIFLTDTNTSNARGRLNANGGGLLLGADNDNAAADSVISFAVDGSERARIDSSGHLQFAGTSEEITLQTSDGSDNGYLNLSGGGACSQNRGAQLVLFGNEKSGLLGTCQLMSGNAGSASSVIQFFTAGTEQARIDASGHFKISCTAQPSATVAGYQFDQGGGTFRVSTGAGASGTTSASISIVGANHNSNIENGANSGAALNLFNANTNDGNSCSISFHNKDNLSASRILGLNISHTNRTGALVFMTSNGSHPVEKMRLINDGKLLIGTNTKATFNDRMLTINRDAGSGIELRNNASSTGQVSFSDTSGSGTGAYRGYIQYQHSTGKMLFGTQSLGRVVIDNNGHLTPNADNTYDLGTTSLRWRNLYTTDLKLSNEGSQNDVDSTWGNYTIQEGHQDLFLLNHRTGKKFKFNLTEVA